MKTENDLGLPPEENTDATTALFTDQPGDGAPMLPLQDDNIGNNYDGAPAKGAMEAVETKTGEKVLRLKLPNGHVYTGKTEHDLLEQLYRGKVAADQAISDREEQIRNLRAAPPSAPPAVTPPSAAPITVAGDQWDPQKYLIYLGEDPMKARAYQDQFYYGGVDPVQATTYAYNVAKNVDQTMLAATFHDRNKDFPISPENSAKLMAVISQHRIVNPNIRDLEWAYGELKRSGSLSPAGPGPDGNQQYDDIDFGASSAPPAAPSAAPAPPQQPSGPQRRGGGAPPSPRNGGGNNTPDVISFDEMTLEQLKEHARKVGVLKH